MPCNSKTVFAAAVALLGVVSSVQQGGGVALANPTSDGEYSASDVVQEAAADSSVARRGGGGSGGYCEWNGSQYSAGDWAYCDSSCKWDACQCKCWNGYCNWSNCYDYCYYDGQQYNPGDWVYNTNSQCDWSGSGSSGGMRRRGGGGGGSGGWESSCNWYKCKCNKYGQLYKCQGPPSSGGCSGGSCGGGSSGGGW